MSTQGQLSDSTEPALAEKEDEGEQQEEVECDPSYPGCMHTSSTTKPRLR